MVSCLPAMGYSERMQRMAEKRAALLTFLASGEVYTCVEVVAELLQVSRPVAFQTCQSLVELCALKSEAHWVNGRKRIIYGITAHGAALSGADGGRAVFDLGRTNSAWISHRIETQLMRLRAQRSGWTEWLPERALLGAGMRKVPDALATAPDGRRVAIEIERHAKTSKRYAEIIHAYLLEIKAGRIDCVEYVTPGIAQQIEQCFLRVGRVKHEGEWISLNEKHRARFRFSNFDAWPLPVMKGGQQ